MRDEEREREMGGELGKEKLGRQQSWHSEPKSYVASLPGPAFRSFLVISSSTSFEGREFTSTYRSEHRFPPIPSLTAPSVFHGSPPLFVAQPNYRNIMFTGTFDLFSCHFPQLRLSRLETPNNGIPTREQRNSLHPESCHPVFLDRNQPPFRRDKFVKGCIG